MRCCQVLVAAECVITRDVGAELLLRRPWFPGNSDIDQLSKVYQALGTPTPEAWPSVQLLPHYMEFTATPAVPLRQIFRQVSCD